MILQIGDWRFQADRQATASRTAQNSLDHCECAYCRNYYQALSEYYPGLIAFLAQFGIDFNGPSEVMPFEPTLMLACYRVQGRVLQWGREALSADGVDITVESGDEDSFLLWAGEMALPWLQEEPVEDVISPANLPEFLERMRQVWLMRHGEEIVFS